MVNYHLVTFIFFSVVELVYGSSRNLPILAFDEGYSHLFGDNNLMILKDGKSAHISLDERTGSFFLFFICSTIFMAFIIFINVCLLARIYFLDELQGLDLCLKTYIFMDSSVLLLSCLLITLLVWLLHFM